LIVLVFSQNCTEYPDCESCALSGPACGWCSATQLCLAGNATGPTGGKCIHSWEYSQCRECEKNTDCRSCGRYENECFWCKEKRSCLHIGHIGCYPADSCPCEDYTACHSCSNTGSCTWCGDQELCIESTNKTYQCTREDQCLCEVNPTCGACMGDPTCGWCDSSKSCVHKMGTACGLSQSCEFSCSRAAHSCEVCAKVAGCGWCPAHQTCMDINTLRSVCAVTTQCPVAPVPCPKKFDGGSFVGGMFLSIGIGILGLAGFVFYRKKKLGGYAPL